MPEAQAAPHVLGIDDGPFEKGRDDTVLVVGVVMAGAALVEGVLTTRLSVDGDDATARLARWIGESRFRPSLRAVFLDGLTIAGLSIIDLPRLAESTRMPVIATKRHAPGRRPLDAALEAAGLPHRRGLVDRAGEWRSACGLEYVASGVDQRDAAALIATQVGKARVPECLRLAHIIAAGVVKGESRGRA